jgi:Protein of unknown function (DUF3833)
MTPEEFLIGRLRGFGCVQGLTGRILRRYTIEMTGAWSEEHRALHLDETYAYIGREGEIFRRSWVVHTDEQGFLIGHDALQAARLRGRQDGDGLRLVFDRPVRPGGRLEPRQVLHAVPITPTQVMMIGRAFFLGVPFATLHSALTKVD